MTDAEGEAHRLRRAFLWAAAFAGLLWLIELAELLLGLDLSQLSIFPRRPETLPGIALAPLLHTSFAHLFANTAPILVLGTLLIYGYPKAARILLPAVYLGSGLGVWLFARPAWHLGASGLTFGMMFFVFTVGIMRWDRRAIALALVAFFLYGGMIWGIFPTARGVSFEYHLFGAGIGVLLAFLLKGLDPPPPEKKYSWEGEGAVDDWPFDVHPGREENRKATTAATISGFVTEDSYARSGILSATDRPTERLRRIRPEELIYNLDTDVRRLLRSVPHAAVRGFRERPSP
jgi:membrane associated rhomboid family serine protease